MRQLAASVLLVGLVGLTLAGPHALSSVAQEASSMAGMADMPAGAVGLTSRVLARIEPATATGQELQLVRVEVAPDATVAAHTHPGTIALCLESGQDGGDLATMPRSPTGPRRAGPHPRVMARSALENAGFGDRWVSWATSSSPTRDKRMVSARVAVGPILGTGSAHVGTAPVSSGSGISSADLQLPTRLGRKLQETTGRKLQEATGGLHP